MLTAVCTCDIIVVAFENSHHINHYEVISMVYEDKIVIESDKRIVTTSIDKIEVFDKVTAKTTVIDTSKYLYRPYRDSDRGEYGLKNRFLESKIDSLLKDDNDTSWKVKYNELKQAVDEGDDKLEVFDTIKSERFIMSLKDKLATYDIDEIRNAVYNLISLFDVNTINDIELYLSLKFYFFRNKESIFRNFFTSFYTGYKGPIIYLLKDYGIGDDDLLKIQNLIVGIQYSSIDILRHELAEKFIKENKRIVQQMEESSNTLENFKKIIQQKYSLSDSDSSDLAWLLVNQNLMRLYHDKWLEYCVCGDIGDRSLKDYIQDCYNNDMISLENKEAVSTFIYYYCYKLNDPINQPDIKTVNEILSCIEEVSKDTSLKSMENLLFSSNSSSNKKLFTSIDDIDLMDGTEFEELIAKLFRKMGYDAEVTKASGDQGVDVIATKNGFKYGIQAKCYSGQVGNSAIQEVVAGKTYYSLNKAIVVTNNFFTKSAIKLAEANGVVLWDRNILKEKLIYINQ